MTGGALLDFLKLSRTSDTDTNCWVIFNFSGILIRDVNVSATGWKVLDLSRMTDGLLKVEVCEFAIDCAANLLDLDTDLDGLRWFGLLINNGDIDTDSL